LVAPRPSGFGLVERHLIVPRDQVAFVRYVLEAHEGLGLMHGDGTGVIVLMAPDSQVHALDALIADLQAEGIVQAVLQPERPQAEHARKSHEKA
jgi:hypothetical protein